MNPMGAPPAGPPMPGPGIDPSMSMMSPELLQLIQSDPALLEAILSGRVPTTPGNPGALPPGMPPMGPGGGAPPMDPQSALMMAMMGQGGGMPMPPMGGGPDY